MTNTTQQSRTVPTGATVLWASALIILGMIVSNAARILPQNAAYADVSEVADLTVLTSKASDDNDVLAVLDRRAERLYIYAIEQGRTVELYQVHDLSDLFTQARNSSSRR